jgi:hypothetical protein
LTNKDCKRILFKIGIEPGVIPKLISNRLLSKEDKQDMLNGYLSVDSLVTHVKIWAHNKMPDYVNGKLAPYKPLEPCKKFQVGRHQKMFISSQELNLPPKF